MGHELERLLLSLSTMACLGCATELADADGTTENASETTAGTELGDGHEVQGASGTNGDLGGSTGTTSGDQTSGSTDGLESSSTGTTGTTPTSGSETGQASGAPIARNDGPYPVRANELLMVSAEQGLLLNDEDPTGGSLVAMPGEPMTEAGGWVDVNPDGSLTYQPPVDSPYGSDRFEYMVMNEQGETATAEVRVAVQPAGAVVTLDALGPRGVRLEGISIGDYTGYAVSGVGDLDGDGHADVVIGAPEADPHGAVGAGESYLVLGGSSLPPVLGLGDAVRYEGIAVNDTAGYAVSGAGDVDGDGHADLLIGAYLATVGGMGSAGAVYLIFGGPGVPVLNLEDADVRFEGIASGDNAGYFVSGAGDINGDGYADLLVGAPSADPNGFSSAGETYLVFGGTALPPVMSLADADVRFNGIDASDYSGFAVSGAGDVNGDGLGDLLIGAYQADPNGLSAAGETYLVYGSTFFPSVIGLADADVRFDGVDSSDFAGTSVRGAGDVNGDGHADLLIGANRADPAKLSSAGETYLIYGGPALPPVVGLVDADVRFEGIAANDYSGNTVSGAGDINADGYADLLVGAVQADPGGRNSAGESYLFFGGPDLAPVIGLADADVRFQGAGPDDLSGQGLSGAGDMNGDGYGDLVIGAYQADPNGISNAGAAYLILGDDLTSETTVLGTSASEVLAAVNGTAADIVVAGEGDDVLVCDGGPDVLRGGAGNDTLVVVDDTFFRIDGGLGTDTVELGGPMMLSLPLAGSRLSSIEQLRLATAGASSIVVSELSLVNLSDASNTLTVDGDADDDVVLESGTWAEPALEDGYMVYTSSSTAAVLRIDPLVTVIEL